MMKVVIASKNAGKIEEFQHYFANTPIDIVMDKSLTDVEETGATFVENALLKARQACIETGLPVLADDSGLVVDALKGAPGVYSARYAGEGKNAQDNNQKLLATMKNIPQAQRSARFYCMLVFLLHAKDPAPIIVHGEWEGRILETPIGEHGFGYDPVFFVPEVQRASAQLALEEKNKISHRARAMKLLKAQLDHPRFIDALGREDAK